MPLCSSSNEVDFAREEVEVEDESGPESAALFTRRWNFNCLAFDSALSFCWCDTPSATPVTTLTPVEVAIGRARPNPRIKSISYNG